MALINWDDHEMHSVVGSAPRIRRATIRMALAMVAAGVAVGQTTPGRTAWEGVYTDAQATRGMTAFGQSCAGCHSLTAEGRSPLVGDPFWRSFSQKNVSQLVEYISTYMPNGNPGSLNKAVYEDIAALMLKSNGFPVGPSELKPEAVQTVQILPKDGSMELPAGALAKVVGCLAKNGSDWEVTRATAPVRAEQGSPDSEDATKALGNRAIALKYVLTRLDAMAGSRVAVTGLLIGTNGVDGLNVTGVTRVAAKCP